VITPEEIAQVTERYRATAGFSLTALRRGVSLLEEPYAQPDADGDALDYDVDVNTGTVTPDDAG